MDFNKYQELAMRTNTKKENEQQILNAALGLNGESGEVADVVKKAMFQGHELDKEKLIEETGDILWYCAQMADALEISLETIAMKNIEKLKDRYPQGFTTNDSINRKR